MTGARTLPQNFYNKVQENITEHPIKQGMKLEVVDKMCVSAMRVATVDEIKGGRLHLLYVDNKQPVSEGCMITNYTAMLLKYDTWCILDYVQLHVEVYIIKWVFETTVN